MLVPVDPPIDVFEEYPCEINTELLSPISVVHLWNPFESISNPEICPIVAVNSPVEVTSNVVAPPFWIFIEPLSILTSPWKDPRRLTL